MNLIVYFSHKGENYSVGVIDKGNTEIVAEYIKEIIGGDLFEIKPLKEYPKDYKSCCDQAKKEFNNSTRPELKEYLDNSSSNYVKRKKITKFRIKNKSRNDELKKIKSK